MGSSKSPPPPPDPAVVAAEQAKANKTTAIAQTGLNAQNQYTPQGSLEYTQNGTWADGTPRFSATQTLSPGEQTIYDRETAARGNYAGLLQDQTGRIGNQIEKPFVLGNQNTEDWYNKAVRSRADTMFGERRSRLEQDLANKGISADSEAYSRAMKDFNQGRNDFDVQAMLQGRSLANAETTQEYMTPINIGAALASGSQVQSPSWVSTPQTGVANTDVAGIYANNYNQQMAGYNAQNASRNAMMGGMFGLGSAALRFLPFSDRRLKRDIVATGNTGPGGLSEYEWTYIWGGPRFVGYMADDVAKVYPAAVARDPSGFMRIDYGRIG